MARVIHVIMNLSNEISEADLWFLVPYCSVV